MSLVGSLEDLNLGDILQIISLSQKSGVLALETASGSGRIVFLQGLVRGAVVKDGPRDLRGVLVGGGFLDADAFENARAHSDSEDVDLPVAIAATTPISGERIDSLCREAVESAVCIMFSWRMGDFSFDVRSEPEPDDPDLLLPTGINAQFLAMEAARMRDEGGRSEDAESDEVARSADAEAAFDEMPAEEMFGVVNESAVASAESEPIEIAPESQGLPEWGDSASPVPEAVDSLARATLEHVESVEEPEPWDAELLSPAPLLEELEAVLDAAEPLLRSDPEPENAPLLESFDDPVLDAMSIEDPEDDFVSSADLIAEPLGEVAAPEVSAEPVIEEAAFVREAPVIEAASPFVAEPEPHVEPMLEAVEPVAAAASQIHETPPDEPSSLPMVIVDPDLVALEWLKYSLKESYEHIHIFQGSEQGLARIRQYLVRGQPPLVLIAPTVPVDPLSGIRDTADFIARLKSQSAKVRVLWLHEQGGGAVRGAPADGAVTRPAHRQLTLGGATPERLEELALAFAANVRAEAARVASAGEAARPERRQGISRDVLERLRDATRALTEASSRGEVLPLVIRFATESFSRVAMFMVRDGVAAGMAQHGLSSCGGPDDDALRELHIDAESSAWMRSVLGSRKSVQGPPEDEGDRNLVAMLGNRVPPDAYLGPIESAGQVIALLYGDNLPDAQRIGDTSGLEVVMHHAGLALDRAALERALIEGDS